MKTKILSIFLAVLMLTSVIPLSATAASDPLTYTKSSDGTYYIVTNCNFQVTDVTVPLEYNGLPVKEIGDNAFTLCGNLSYITISNNVTKIGSWAFANCYHLTIVNLPTALETIADYTFYNCPMLMVIVLPNTLKTIGDYAFSGSEKITAVNIPGSVTKIGIAAYGNCNKIASLSVDDTNSVYHDDGNCIIETATKTIVAGCNKSVIPTDGSVTSIGDYAFYYCENHANFELPNSITKIGKHAFASCRSLTKFIIPDSVITIRDNAFTNCRYITNIEIPSSVTSIGAYAFYNCQNLKVFEIPKSVTVLGKNVFAECSLLTDIYCEAESQPDGWDSGWTIDCNATVHWGETAPEPEPIVPEPYSPLHYKLSEDETYYILYDCETTYTKEVIIPSEYKGLPVKVIDYGTFRSCKQLTGIKIPDSIVEIGAYAFSDCEKISTINIPSSVEKIGAYAFQRCLALTGINIPNKIKTIEEGIISGSHLITSIKIPASVTFIDEKAFSYCEGIKSLTVDDNNKVYHDDGNCIIETKEKALVVGCKTSKIPADGSVIYINNNAFCGSDGLTGIEIPKTIKTIGDYAFYHCYNLESIVIPNSVLLIGDNAFLYCINLKSIELPDSLAYLGEGAFHTCTALESITIPTSLTELKSQTFAYCESLTTIEIPSNIEKIGDEMFGYCENLTDIYCQAEYQPGGWSGKWRWYCNANVHWGAKIANPNLNNTTRTVIGDVDFDGNITADDYITLKRIFFGQTKLESLNGSETASFRCDINKNRKIDADDYISLKRAYFGTYNI